MNPPTRRPSSLSAKEVGARSVQLDFAQRRDRGQPYDPATESPADFQRRSAWGNVPFDAFAAQLGAAVDLTRYATIVTHSSIGDYGRHPQHRQIHAHMSRLFPARITQLASRASANAHIQLNPDELRQKLAMASRYEPDFPTRYALDRWEFYTVPDSVPQSPKPPYPPLADNLR